jgi:hypothetical protein
MVEWRAVLGAVIAGTLTIACSDEAVRERGRRLREPECRHRSAAAASIALCLGLVAGAAPAASPQDASSVAPKALRVASAFDPQMMEAM